MTTTNLGQTFDLFADPANTVRDCIDTLDDGDEETIGDLHEHRQARSDDILNVDIFGSRFWRDSFGQISGQSACFVLDRGDHLFVDL